MRETLLQGVLILIEIGGIILAGAIGVGLTWLVVTFLKKDAQRVWIPSTIVGIFAAALVAILFFMNGLAMLGALIAILLLGWWLIWLAYYIVPTAAKAAVTRFDERLRHKNGKLMEFIEGLMFVIPFIEKVRGPYSMQLITKEFTEIKDGKQSPFTFQSKDNLQLEVKGKYQYRIDDLDKYINVENEATVTGGIEGAIKQEIRMVGGAHEGQNFVHNSEVMALLINERLRLPRPTFEEKGMKVSDILRNEDIPEVKDAAGNIVKPAIPKHKDNYVDNIVAIREKVEKEHLEADKKSPVEDRFGLDVVDIIIDDVDFTADTKKFLEARAKAKAEAQAKEELAKKFSDILARMPDDMPSEKAVLNTLDLMSLIDRKVVTLDAGDNPLGDAAAAHLATTAAAASAAIGAPPAGGAPKAGKTGGTT